MNRSRWTFLAIPLLFGSLGCEVHDHDYDDDYWDDYGPVVCGTDPDIGTIDADSPLEATPGDGVGVFVEYETGGRWHVFTTCDTDRSGYECYFDILATPIGRAALSGVSPDALERADELRLAGQDSVQLTALTSVDTDGFFFETDPGAAIQLDVLLDGACGNAYVYWVGDGAIHAGAPTNPFELEPVAP